MLHLFLDTSAGLLYLLHKVFSDRVEVASPDRPREESTYWKYRLWAPSVYLAGVLPTVLVFWQTQRLTFGALELGGIPAMAGSILAARRKKDPPKWLSIFAGLMVPLGMWYAATHPVVRDLSPSMDLFARRLELTGALGFLVGVFLQMFENKSVTKCAYAFFFIMNVATAMLMAIDGRWLWVPQQVLSVIFIADALMKAPLLKRLLALWKRLRSV